MKERYDYLVVGAGLFGSVCAYELSQRNKSVLVIDRRSHIGGNCYTENLADITIHKYGPHIFHTDNKFIWDYVNNFVEFSPFINSPIANYNGKLFNLPFNMNTFYQLFGINNPNDVKKRIANENTIEHTSPINLEEQAISMVGKTIYDTLIKEYTEKQWGIPCTELRPDIIKRLPVRFTFNNNYFNTRYQGIPTNGYTELFTKLLANCDVLLNTSFNDVDIAFDNVIYSGSIDELFDFDLGKLQYRSLIFETKLLQTDNYQGVAVMNYTDKNHLYTRIIEHKHFLNVTSDNTVITYEYPIMFENIHKTEPYYPIETNDNLRLYNEYVSRLPNNIIVGGRLGSYKYMDMDKVIESALDLISSLQLK